jgi:hypothetical protein
MPFWLLNYRQSKKVICSRARVWPRKTRNCRQHGVSTAVGGSPALTLVFHRQRHGLYCCCGDAANAGRRGERHGAPAASGQRRLNEHGRRRGGCRAADSQAPTRPRGERRRAPPAGRTAAADGRNGSTSNPGCFVISFKRVCANNQIVINNRDPK